MYIRIISLVGDFYACDRRQSTGLNLFPDFCCMGVSFQVFFFFFILFFTFELWFLLKSLFFIVFWLIFFSFFFCVIVCVERRSVTQKKNEFKSFIVEYSCQMSWLFLLFYAKRQSFKKVFFFVYVFAYNTQVKSGMCVCVHYKYVYIFKIIVEMYYNL